MKINDKLLEVSENCNAGYYPLTSYDSWLVAVLNQGEDNDSLEDIDFLEYHTETDEVFILLKGSAALLISGGKEKPDDIKLVNMRPLKCYNVKKGVWHSIILQNSGTVAIVENSDTSKSNSKYYYLNEEEKERLIRLN